MNTVEIGFSNHIPVKRNKGKSLLTFPESYCVVDIETTGLSSKYDDIIELSAVKVVDGSISDKFSSLVKPAGRFLDDNDKWLFVDEFITELTGITNEMLETAPSFSDVADDFLAFVGDSVIVGHNVNFDINFIYDAVISLNGKVFSNDFSDLLRISKKILKDLPNHKLKTIASHFEIAVENSHRGIDDCITAYKCFEKLKEFADANDIVIDIHTNNSLDLRKIKAVSSDFDESHPLFNKVCVFTGKLERLTRSEAAQLVVDCGGICENGVTKMTNFLILGNNDYCNSIKDGKSNKQKKAEKLILSGQDLQIMPEDVFYEMFL